MAGLKEIKAGSSFLPALCRSAQCLRAQLQVLGVDTTCIHAVLVGGFSTISVDLIGHL